MLDAPPKRQAAPLALRVAFLGDASREWLGGWVEAVEPEALDRGGDDGTEPAVDAVVVDPDPAGMNADQARRLVQAARAAGAPVIALPGGGGAAAQVDLADLTLGPAPSANGGPGATLAVRPVDPRAINPLGFRQADVGGLGCVTFLTAPDLSPARAMLSQAAAHEPVLCFAPHEVSTAGMPHGVLKATLPEEGPEVLYATLKERLGALDHPSLHASEADRAAQLVRLCASGVPVAAAEISDALAAMLGAELAGAISEVTVSDLLDLDRRERVSIAQRRAALRDHSLDARWRALCAATGIALPARPKVSVIFSTRRQEWLWFGLAQVQRQNYEPRELVVCLHGDDFSDDVEERLRAEVEGPLEVVHVASELTLGDALNQGVEAASGELVTKMDDDDYYSVDHLWDLVLASEYSGADLVGKAAEFVYLEEIDVTIRQLTRDVETRLAGGGMMFRREPLRAIGGWPSLSRAEDLAIVRRFEENGRAIHRTHPHGYILNRHGRDHTWRPYVDYFLFRSGRQWRGLRFDQTGIR